MGLECPKFPSDFSAMVGDERVEILSENPINQFYRERGFDVEETGGHDPNTINVLSQRAYDQAFSKSPLFPRGFGVYVIDDRAVDIFKSHNMGANSFLTIDPLYKVIEGPQGPVVSRSVTAIKVKERWPTLVPTQEAFHLEPKSEYSIFTFDKISTNVMENGIINSAQMFYYKEGNWLLPCFDNPPDVDIWVDPFWPESLFMSARLVEALDKEGLLQGKEYGWNVRPCRAASSVELEHDLIPERVRAIPPAELSKMSLPDFRKLCEPWPLPLSEENRKMLKAERELIALKKQGMRLS